MYAVTRLANQEPDLKLRLRARMRGENDLGFRQQLAKNEKRSNIYIYRKNDHIRGYCGTG